VTVFSFSAPKFFEPLPLSLEFFESFGFSIHFSPLVPKSPRICSLSTPCLFCAQHEKDALHTISSDQFISVCVLFSMSVCVLFSMSVCVLFSMSVCISKFKIHVILNCLFSFFHNLIVDIISTIITAFEVSDFKFQYNDRRQVPSITGGREVPIDVYAVRIFFRRLLL
jgi:hypothetical protein